MDRSGGDQGVVPLHRNRDFRRLWAGQAVSDLGSNASGLAFPLLVLALTGSPLQAGLVGAARLVADTLFSLPAGALVDRWNRRTILICCEAVRAAALGLLAIAVVTGWASIPLIISVAVVEAAGSALFGPAQTGALRHIVPTSQLAVAAARNETRSYAASLAGGPLGGALFGVARFAPFLFDALTYLASLVAVALIRRPLQIPRTEQSERLTRSVRRGLQFVLAEPFLRAVLGIAPLLNIAASGLFFLLIVVLRERGLHPAGVGVVQSMVLVGGLAGSLIAPWLLGRMRAPVLIPTMSWLAATLIGVTAVLPGTYVLAVPLVLVMLISPSVNAALFAYKVAITPDAMQGRVQSAVSMLANLLNPLGPVLAGAIAELWGGQWAFAAFAGICATAAVLATASRGVRKMRPLEELQATRGRHGRE